MGDSIFIFLLALMLFGPKKLPQLARQLGKLMAEFRKASNDFRMQMEDELRLEEQKEHQAKVDALKPPPSSTPNPDIPTDDPVHPHLPAPATESAPQPIAESGDLRMMPPSTGLPAESSAYSKTYTEPDDLPAVPEHSIPEPAIPEPAITEPAIPEHSIAGGVGVPPLGAGSSSEEPLAELEPPPDRSQPVMAGQGERATHA